MTDKKIERYRRDDISGTLLQYDETSGTAPFEGISAATSDSTGGWLVRNAWNNQFPLSLLVGEEFGILGGWHSKVDKQTVETRICVDHTFDHMPAGRGPYMSHRLGLHVEKKLKHLFVTNMDKPYTSEYPVTVHHLFKSRVSCSCIAKVKCTAPNQHPPSTRTPACFGQLGASNASVFVIDVSSGSVSWSVQQEIVTSGNTLVTGAGHAVMSPDDSTV